jgi:hypothetical protein
VLIACLGAFALAMMQITKTIPHRWPSNWRRDDDPNAFDTYRMLYASAIGAGYSGRYRADDRSIGHRRIDCPNTQT